MTPINKDRPGRLNCAVVRCTILLTLSLLLSHNAIAAAGPIDPLSIDQTYEVVYHHEIENKTDEPITNLRVFLPVPQTDQWQQIDSFQVETFGTKVEISDRTDQDGNALKRLVIPTIEPGKTKKVGFSCTIRPLHPNPPKLDRTSPASLDEIPEQIRTTHTRNHAVFGLDAPIIKQEADRLLKEHPNPIDRAIAIHDLVASRIKYKKEGGWDAAPAVLERGTGSCSEFTYVFCALCRATGIPTRFVGTSRLRTTSNLPYRDKVWHRWPQAYLPRYGWTPFDPTIDRGNPPKDTCVGIRPEVSLVLTYKNDTNRLLGSSYIGANSHYKSTKRKRYFIWSQGTQQRFEAAQKLAQQGKRHQAIRSLTTLINDSPETRGAIQAVNLLNQLRSTEQGTEDAKDAAHDRTLSGSLKR